MGRRYAERAERAEKAERAEREQHGERNRRRAATLPHSSRRTSPPSPSSPPSPPYETSHRLHPPRRQARPEAANGRRDEREAGARRRVLQGAVEGARRDRRRTRAGVQIRVSHGEPLVQSQPELEALFARLRGAPLPAVDTEAASFHRFIDRVY